MKITSKKNRHFKEHVAKNLELFGIIFNLIWFFECDENIWNENEESTCQMEGNKMIETNLK
jgi:hypothetical protein